MRSPGGDEGAAVVGWRGDSAHGGVLMAGGEPGGGVGVAGRCIICGGGGGVLVGGVETRDERGLDVLAEVEDVERASMEMAFLVVVSSDVAGVDIVGIVDDDEVVVAVLGAVSHILVEVRTRFIGGDGGVRLLLVSGLGLLVAGRFPRGDIKQGLKRTGDGDGRSTSGWRRGGLGVGGLGVTGRGCGGGVTCRGGVLRGVLGGGVARDVMRVTVVIVVGGGAVVVGPVPASEAVGEGDAPEVVVPGGWDFLPRAARREVGGVDGPLVVADRLDLTRSCWLVAEGARGCEARGEVAGKSRVCAGRLVRDGVVDCDVPLAEDDVEVVGGGWLC